MANINKTLGTDLASIAELLRSKGRGKDTILAHITPKEAALLKRRGGRGSINPNTGLPEFDDGEGGYDSAPVEQAPVEQAQAPVTDYSQAYTPEAPVSQDQQIQPSVPAAGFDPFTYGTAPGEQVYRGEAGVPTPAYAAPSAGANAFGATGGAAIDPTKPGAAALLEPITPDSATDKGEGKGTSGAPSSLSDLLKGVTGAGALKAALAGGLGLYGASRARQGAQQVQAATQEQKAIAQPYTEQGKQLVAQAQAGQLTPTSQQALDAAKAQLAQSTSNRGGVGAQQAANQIAGIYQTLLDNQYKYGLQIMQIGDNISLGAIKSGLQLDQQLQTATNNFYSQLASLVGGQPIRG